METMNEMKDEVKYITDYTTYIKMKEKQKQIALERKKGLLMNSNNYVRCFNIIYGMVKGKSYKQIENKVRDYNEPSKFFLIRIIKEYNLDESKFEEAINYGR